jgi:hypothetical protein
MTKHNECGETKGRALAMTRCTSSRVLHSSQIELTAAMATDAPDPRTFTTWEDAFQYPIPIVRKLEQELRNNADENREKLRSLVGYRLQQS